MGKTRYIKAKAFQQATAMVLGVAVGTVACISVVGIATTVSGKIIGGICAFTASSGLTNTAAHNISDPIVELLNDEIYG